MGRPLRNLSRIVVAGALLLLAASGVAAQEVPTPPAQPPTDRPATEVPPPPLTMAFLAWVRARPAALAESCALPRARTVHFAQSGDDATGDGTAERPFKTVAMAAKILAASQGDLALLFRRGDEWNEEKLLHLDKPRVTVGAWGPTGPAPRFSMFRLKYASGWGGITAKRFIHKEETDVAWVRWDQGGAPPDPKLVLRRMNSIGDVEKTPNSFWYDKTKKFLHVHVTQNGAAVDFVKAPVLLEACPRNTTNGFDVTADGCLIDGVRTDGWGLDPENPHAPRSYGIRWRLGPGQTGIARGCETYYGGTTLHGSWRGDGPGGRVVIRACRAGFAARGPQGEAIFSTFAEGGGQETWFVRCVAVAGTLPQGADPPRRGSLVHGGTGGRAKIGLAVAHECVATDGPIGVLRGALFEDLPPAKTPEECRGFVVGEFLAGLFLPWIGYRDTSYVNCAWDIGKHGPLEGGALAEAVAADQRFDGFVWNALIRLDFTGQRGDGARAAVFNPDGESLAAAWFLHSRIAVHESHRMVFSVDHDAGDEKRAGAIRWENSRIHVLPAGAPEPPFETFSAEKSVGLEYDFEGKPRSAEHPTIGPVEAVR